MTETLAIGSLCRLSHRTFGAYSSTSDKELKKIIVKIVNFSANKQGKPNQQVDVVMVSPRPSGRWIVERGSLIPLDKPFSDNNFKDAFV